MPLQRPGIFGPDHGFIQPAPHDLQGQYPVVVTPATAALVLTTFAPTVATPRVVTPGTKALVLTTFAPTVSTPRVVTPGTAALILTRFAPTVATPRVVTPSTKALVLTSFAPTISTPRLVTPATRALTLTTFAPTVLTPQSVRVTPGTATLFLTTYAPSLPDLIAGSPGGGSGGNLAQFSDSDHFPGPPFRRPSIEEDEPLEVPDITPAVPVAARVDNRPAIIALYQAHAIDEETFAVLLAAA